MRGHRSVVRFETLAGLIRERRAVAGSDTALIFQDRKMTYEALDIAANRVAQALIREGVTPGSRVAVLDRDSDRTYQILFGAAKAGAVFSSLNWRLTPGEVAAILEDCGAEVLFIGKDLAPKLEEIRSHLPNLRRAVILDESFETWCGADEDPRLEADAEDVAVLMYTSGTTGLPKGVALAHRSFFAVVRATKAAEGDWIGWSSRDVSLLTLPTFHIGGLWWAVVGLAEGATNVVMDMFVAWRALELMQKHRVTKVCMVPAMMQLIMAEPARKKTDLSSVGHIMYGGAPMPLPLLEKVQKLFQCELLQVYGLTETGNMAVWLRPNEHRDLTHPRMRAAGKPYPGVEVRIDSDEPVGEICIRSPANMVEYHGRPEATAETLRDGWIHTGDVGFIDEDGYVHVSDRLKDMIIYGSEKVYPAEIEAALYEHPDVVEAAVIGVPDDKWGELVKAFVVLSKEATVGPPELIAHLRKALAEYKVPKSIELVGQLPRTRSGKVQKNVLREPYWKDRDRKV